MNIVVIRISEEEGLSIAHTFPDGEPELKGQDTRLVGPSVLQLHATREGTRVEVAGSLQALVRIECSRCLSQISLPVEQRFDLLYLPPSGTRLANEERELGEDDLDVAFYRDQTIDLDDLVREQIELALPMSMLCDENCKGLCPVCGADLNEVECGCVSESLDPRWAALRTLKPNNTGE